jgi:hypothetical protein
MIQIVLDDEQAKALAVANGEIKLLDQHGRTLGYVARNCIPGVVFSTEEIAAAKRSPADGGPRYTTAQVIDHLRSLESR